MGSSNDKGGEMKLLKTTVVTHGKNVCSPPVCPECKSEKVVLVHTDKEMIKEAGIYTEYICSECRCKYRAEWEIGEGD